MGEMWERMQAKAADEMACEPVPVKIPGLRHQPTAASFCPCSVNK